MLGRADTLVRGGRGGPQTLAEIGCTFECLNGRGDGVDHGLVAGARPAEFGDLVQAAAGSRQLYSTGSFR